MTSSLVSDGRIGLLISWGIFAQIPESLEFTQEGTDVSVTREDGGERLRKEGYGDSDNFTTVVSRNASRPAEP